MAVSRAGDADRGGGYRRSSRAEVGRAAGTVHAPARGHPESRVTTKPGTVSLRAPGTEHLSRVREIVEATGLFRADEVEIALEVFQSAVAAPGLDYTSVGAFD